MKTFKPQQQPEPRGDVEVGDQIYIHHEDGPCCGRVVCHGKHGATVDVDGKQHRVKWDKVLGHKQRAPQRYNVLDHGEDGMLVEDAQGRRRFIKTPNEAKDDPMVAKSQRPILLFMKAAGAPPGPGLQQKKVTDKNGVQTTRWVSIDKGGPPAQKGQHVGFKNGEHSGHGHVVAAGQHGVTVRDGAGGEHRVRHEHITHHWGADGAPDASPHEQQPSAAPQAEATPAAAKPFFEPSEVEQLPDPKKFRHSAFKSWEEAEAKAPEAREQFHAILKGLGKTLGFEEPSVGPDQMTPEMLSNDSRYLFMGPIKKQDKSTSKVMNDYGGDWGGLKDLVRATVAVKNVDDVHKLLGGLKEAGVQMLQRPKDNMTHGTADGYRDINLIMAAPNGMPVELQVQVKAITKAKSEAHGYYNENIAIEQRNRGKPLSEWSDKDSQEFAKNRAQQLSIYNNAWATVTGEQTAATSDEKNQDGILQKSTSPNMIIFVKGVRHAVR